MVSDDITFLGMVFQVHEYLKVEDRNQECR